MGMFDSLYEGSREDYDAGIDWDAYPASYQVEILGSRGHDFYRSLATVIDGVLANIDNERAHALPLINYSGHLIQPTDAA